MVSLPFAVGIAVVDESAVKNGFDYIAQGMMYHPIPERCSGDFAAFWFMDGEVSICSWLVAESRKFILECQQMIRQLMLESRGRSMSTFASGGFAGCQQQVLPACEALKR